MEETEKSFREKSVVPHAGYLEGQPTYRHESFPLCFAQVCDLTAEFTKADKLGSPNLVALDFVIHEEKECKAFTKWQQGFTPKEHREMIDRQWERKWRIITGIILVILAGLFTLLGAYIANLN